MASYDDILKQMQGSFMKTNPKLFGKPGGFSSSNFNFNDPDVIKPGGGGFGGGTGGDGNVGGTGGDTGGGYGDAGNNLLGQTTYGGQFRTDLGSLGETLGGFGYGEGFLGDPGAKFGFGKDTEYGKYFGTFDVQGYEQSLTALGELQEQKFADIGKQYEFGRGQLQGSLQDTLLQMMGEESTTGLVGGRAGTRRTMTRDIGEQKFTDLGRQTQSKYGAAQEQTAKQLGMLEGTLADFISKQQNIALNIEMSDPAEGPADSEYQPWSTVSVGSSMSDSQLRGMGYFDNYFADLTNSQQAWASFMSKAHSNLNSSQLADLANAMRDQWLDADEAGES